MGKLYKFKKELELYPNIGTGDNIIKYLIKMLVQSNSDILRKTYLKIKLPFITLADISEFSSAYAHV